MRYTEKTSKPSAISHLHEVSQQGQDVRGCLITLRQKRQLHNVLRMKRITCSEFLPRNTRDHHRHLEKECRLKKEIRLAL
jgi:hypothetical protein